MTFNRITSFGRLIYLIVFLCSFEQTAAKEKPDFNQPLNHRIPDQELDASCSRVREQDKQECQSFIKSIKREQGNQIKLPTGKDDSIRMKSQDKFEKLPH